MDGFARVMALTMTYLDELEKDQPQLTWKSQNTNLLMLTQLRLDKNNE